MLPMVELCLIVPHPDDEVFGAGGILRRLADNGERTAVLTLTRGGAGRTLGLVPQDELPAKREAELHAALSALGVEAQDRFIFDYPDFVTDPHRGMELRPGLQAIDRQELVGTVVRTLDQLQPRIVLTFPPNGSNGHPDHVTTHNVVMQAIQEARVPPEKLYYYASELPYTGAVPEGFMPVQELARLHLPPTHYVELGYELEAKMRAMGHHETQALSVLNFMKRFPRRLRIESFHRAIPSGSDPHNVETVFRL